MAAKESGLSKEFISNLNSNENMAMRELYLSTQAVQQAITAQDAAIKRIARSDAARSAYYKSISGRE